MTCPHAIVTGHIGGWSCRECGAAFVLAPVPKVVPTLDLPPAPETPPGFRLEPDASRAMCGGRGPAHCRKGASCRKHNRCVYL